MSTDDVNAILLRIATFEATIVTRLDSLVADNVRGEQVHRDHEARLRTLETTASESRGVLKLLTAGGAVGALIAAAVAVALRSVGA